MQRPKTKDQRPTSGFTLLELMIVMFIIIILAAVALPQLQKTINHARETVLRDNLYKMRSLLDQYAADKGKLPGSLQDLVDSGYMREIPVDPMTGEAAWDERRGPDPNSSEGEEGVVDVKSLSPESPPDGGPPYNEW